MIGINVPVDIGHSATVQSATNYQLFYWFFSVTLSSGTINSSTIFEMRKLMKDIKSPNRIETVHSVVSLECLKKELVLTYDFDVSLELQLYLRGINDTYRITTTSNNYYALRLSRVNWRSEADAKYEISLLRHLSDNSLSVPHPKKNKDGNYIHSVVAPEGERRLSIFTWLPGTSHNIQLDNLSAKSFGGELAQCHLKSMSLDSTPHSLDIEDDLEKYLHCLLKVLKHRKDDCEFMRTMIPIIRERILNLKGKLPWGPCHGDIHPANANVNIDGSVGILDFDVCGEWYQCFDVASYLWSVKLFQWRDDGLTNSFAEGYEEYRVLSMNEKQAIPLLMVARDAWHLVTWARNENALSCGWFHDHNLDWRMKLFRELVNNGLK